MRADEQEPDTRPTVAGEPEQEVLAFPAEDRGDALKTVERAYLPKPYADT